MKVIKELNTVSNFKPVNGVLLDMYNIVIEKNVTRETAIQFFKKNTGNKSFKVPYKRLKDKLLQGILENSFSNLPSVQKQHIDVIKRYAEAKILLFLDKKISGIKVAEETIKKAEWLGMTEIALSLARDSYAFGSITKISSQKFRELARKVQKLKQTFDEEFEVQCLYFKLLNLSRKKRSLADSFQELKKIRSYVNESNSYRFRLYYHQAMNMLADDKNDKEGILQNTKAALQFFDSKNTPLPYTTRWAFLINLVPIYLNQKDYIQTERTLNTCLDLPTKGSFNWHLTLLFKALYGFSTHKPAIALHAWQTAHSVPKKFDSPIITERWQMIEAYLAFYGKLGRIHYPKSFRLYRFLNTIQQDRKDHPQKANLIVLEFIHLLIDGKEEQYLEKAYTIEQAISNHFNKHALRRTKYFLRCLRAVQKGNFHHLGAPRHAAKHLGLMQGFDNETDLNVLDREVVPYDLLWKDILFILEEKKRKR